MMTSGFDPASVAEVADAPASLEQFEPDNAGTADGGEPAAPVLADSDDDPAWIVWADALLEGAWADSELADSWLGLIRIPPL